MVESSRDAPPSAKHPHPSNPSMKNLVSRVRLRSVAFAFRQSWLVAVFMFFMFFASAGCYEVSDRRWSPIRRSRCLHTGFNEPTCSGNTGGLRSSRFTISKVNPTSLLSIAIPGKRVVVKIRASSLTILYSTQPNFARPKVFPLM